MQLIRQCEPRNVMLVHGKNNYINIIVICVYIIGRSEDGGAVHELQRACGRQGHHAVDSPVRATQCHACAWRGGQDAVP